MLGSTRTGKPGAGAIASARNLEFAGFTARGLFRIDHPAARSGRRTCHAQRAGGKKLSAPAPADLRSGLQSNSIASASVASSTTQMSKVLVAPRPSAAGAALNRCDRSCLCRWITLGLSSNPKVGLTSPIGAVYCSTSNRNGPFPEPAVAKSAFMISWQS